VCTPTNCAKFLEKFAKFLISQNWWGGKLKKPMHTTIWVAFNCSYYYLSEWFENQQNDRTTIWMTSTHSYRDFHNFLKTIKTNTPHYGSSPIAFLMFIHASTLFQFALIIFFFCLCRLTSPWIHFNKLIVLISSQSSHTSLYGNWRMCLGFTFYCKIKNWQENWELTRFFMLILYDKFMDASLELFPELKSSIRLN